jgi:hypothetical protein
LRLFLGRDRPAKNFISIKNPKKTTFGIVKKSISISELIKNYQGIPINFDFDEELIGIEVRC